MRPEMIDVPWWVWGLTLAGLAALLLLDLLIIGRKSQQVTAADSLKWVGFYVGCAILFGLGVWYFADAHFAVEYFTGYLTEYSLSVDNLFVFMVLMASFAVPAVHQQRVLLVGIVLALAMRGVFIAIGSALITEFIWIFFVFGGFLLWTAARLVGAKGESGTHGEGGADGVVRWVRKVFPVTGEYHGHRCVVKIDGRRHLTPLLLVIAAIGSADLLFAMDSIPAIFGITQAPFLVFAANAFALMGLRQLYFVIGGLMTKLVYLSRGLAPILGFIGVKLIVHGLCEYQLLPGWMDINNWVSLGFIVVVLAITTVASLAKARETSPQSSSV